MLNGNREVELEAENKALRARVSDLESIAANCPQVEKTLRDQLQFLQILIDTIPNPIFFKDRNGKYLGCNKAFERRVGLTRGDIIEKSDTSGKAGGLENHGPLKAVVDYWPPKGANRQNICS